MSKTYTYTARNANDPAHIITFTLHDRQLVIEPVMLEHADRLRHGPRHDVAHGELEVLKLFKDSRPPLIKLSDVAAHLDRDRLRLVAWGQLPDRQWRPITLSMDHVDNVPAARAFIRELNRRRMAALRRDRLQRWVAPRVALFAGGIAAVVFATIMLRFRST